ncbi:DUF2007 domain-containing protein [Enterovibrio nigricans]|uniref:Putative signal transducing protein n=1 Tax=Enterovibrio nigricans DSM 22720 TaxID=1121868 RepID=A0A1T4VMC6_9GAMM|nr:DUF2007 domain-containing protein [Enterovibrio nigricans]PKF49171.1 DUF2007 domain-containing protein [Enterovibrio nigricans]SKA66110.1 Putative signal transducing protein [Enterovibrio nigricans DSM 22720]
MSWIQVYSASNSLEAHSLKGMLESEGIRVMLKGESLSSATGELPADVLAVTLWVDIAREAVARKALLHYEAQSSVVWFCRDCQEENGGNFEICWQCGAPRTETV